MSHERLNVKFEVTAEDLEEEFRIEQYNLYRFELSNLARELAVEDGEAEDLLDLLAYSEDSRTDHACKVAEWFTKNGWRKPPVEYDLMGRLRKPWWA